MGWAAQREEDERAYLLGYLAVLNLERSFVTLVIITLTSCFAQWTFEQWTRLTVTIVCGCQSIRPNAAIVGDCTSVGVMFLSSDSSGGTLHARKRNQKQLVHLLCWIPRNPKQMTFLFHLCQHLNQYGRKAIIFKNLYRFHQQWQLRSLPSSLIP